MCILITKGNPLKIESHHSKGRNTRIELLIDTDNSCFSHMLVDYNLFIGLSVANCSVYMKCLLFSIIYIDLYLSLLIKVWCTSVVINNNFNELIH